MLQTDSTTSRSRGNALSVTLAWLVILACCGRVIWEGNRPPTVEEIAARPVELSLPAELTAKLCVGLAEWSPEARNIILDQARALEDEGPLGQVARAVLAAELTGLDDAQKELGKARDVVDKMPDGQKRGTLQHLIDVLDRLYSTDGAPASSPDASAAQAPPAATTVTTPPVLSADDQTLLETHLVWVGRLAPLVRPLAEGTPQREKFFAPLRIIPLMMAGFLLWAGICGLGGLAGIITLLVLGLQGRLRHGFAPASGYGAIYAEVFAAWLTIFVGGKQIAEHFNWSGLALSLGLTLGGLIAALAWAVLRGVPWRQMRCDLGLHAGRGIVIESLAGVLTYCMAIPLLVVALMVTLVLIGVQKIITPDAAPPGHPVQQIITGGDWTTIIITLVFASVIAPLVEETIFRGALFRHLRDGTRWLGLIGSFVIAAGFSSFVFASIHPQGWPFIPVLASLAFAFCLGREWRGSLLPGMVAHGLNNFVILTLSIVLLRQT